MDVRKYLVACLRSTSHPTLSPSHRQPTLHRMWCPCHFSPLAPPPLMSLLPFAVRHAVTAPHRPHLACVLGGPLASQHTKCEAEKPARLKRAIATANDHQTWLAETSFGEEAQSPYLYSLESSGLCLSLLVLVPAHTVSFFLPSTWCAFAANRKSHNNDPCSDPCTRHFDTLVHRILTLPTADSCLLGPPRNRPLNLLSAAHTVLAGCDCRPSLLFHAQTATNIQPFSAAEPTARFRSRERVDEPSARRLCPPTRQRGSSLSPIYRSLLLALWPLARQWELCADVVETRPGDAPRHIRLLPSRLGASREPIPSNGRTNSHSTVDCLALRPVQLLSRCSSALPKNDIVALSRPYR